MYLEYWHLNQPPFANAPSRNAFFSSPHHEEALRRLLYAIQHRKGVAMLTAEVGCGKTTVTKALVDYLNKDQVQFAMISNPALQPEELLKTVLLKLGGKPENSSKSQVLDHLNTLLAANESSGRATVLAIDEAHVIASRETFDEIRMLLNFQTDNDFLLTLLLIGQPPLLRNIAELRPLKERIAVKYHLPPLDFQSTLHYLLFRLKNAGATRGIFTRQAVQMLYEASGGIPLRINNLCECCLLLGLMYQARMVDTRVMQAAIENLGD
jgi:general secretion pathway protein A